MTLSSTHKVSSKEKLYPTTKILLVDDDPQLLKSLASFMTAQGHQVLTADNERDAIGQLQSYNPGLVLLDIFMPNPIGVELLGQIKKISNTPVIMLSAAKQEEYIIKSLEAGADDYIAKPFSPAILLARVYACLKRYRPLEFGTDYYVSGPLKIDFKKRIVSLFEDEIKLTSTEYDLLKYLTEHSEQVLTHRQILRDVWGPTAVERPEYLRVYTNHLRKKIEVPTQMVFIENEPGVGYRFKQHPASIEQQIDLKTVEHKHINDAAESQSAHL